MGWGAFAALDTSGAVFAWNGYDRLSDVTRLAGVYTSVDTNGTSVCATSADGSVTCGGLVDGWDGCGGTGAAPFGSLSSLCTTVDLYACGLNTSGYPVCWTNSTYQPGILEEPARPFTSLSCGFNYVCGVALNGAIICWGPEEDTYGNLTAP